MTGVIASEKKEARIDTENINLGMKWYLAINMFLRFGEYQ